MIEFTALMRGLAAIVLACLLSACAGVLAEGAAGSAAQPAQVAGVFSAVKAWASSSDGQRKLAAMPDMPIRTAGASKPEDLIIDPAEQAQVITGYGAAMTDSSAEIFQNRMTHAQRDALFADLFGQGGIGLSFVRVPIGASDFSLKHYSLDDMPKGQDDPVLRHFSMQEPRRAQLPTLKAAKAVNPGLTLMASPWSAPGWMKDTDSLIKGQLRAQHYDAFARYFAAYLDAMEQEGLPVSYISVQNEPAFEPADYPGMRFTAPERARFVAENLGPLLARRSRPVGILDWDHNWDKPEEPLAVLADSKASAFVAGVAWHCYAGNPSVMEQVRSAFPAKDVFFSECSGGDWAPDWGGSLGWMTDNLIIAATRAGSKGTILWNLALDEQRGPHLGGCGNCRPVVTIDSRTGAVTRNVEYYVLGHVSRFVRPGARAIASRGAPSGVTHVAFRNADGSLVLLAHNANAAPASYTVRWGSKAYSVTMPAGEVMTFTWPETAKAD